VHGGGAFSTVGWPRLSPAFTFQPTTGVQNRLTCVPFAPLERYPRNFFAGHHNMVLRQKARASSLVSLCLEPQYARCRIYSWYADAGGNTASLQRDFFFGSRLFSVADRFLGPSRERPCCAGKTSRYVPQGNHDAQPNCKARFHRRLF